MEVLFFLKRRTRLIRHYYDRAAAPFLEDIRKIEAEEPPFVPPYGESIEPPFMEEWSEAQEALSALGRTCISMLSAALKLYFAAYARKLRVSCDEKRFKKGFVDGYRGCFEKALNLDWHACPADLGILEQVVLARNADEHPKDIAMLAVKHDDSVRAKYTQPFFITDHEREAIALDEDGSWWLGVTVYVSRENLFAAIGEVEKLAKWLDENIH